MVITTLAIAAGTAAKWIVAAKILGTTGVFFATAGPIIDRSLEKKKDEKHQ